jgi:hypothetical protein
MRCYATREEYLASQEYHDRFHTPRGNGANVFMGETPTFESMDEFFDNINKQYEGLPPSLRPTEIPDRDAYFQYVNNQMR